MTIRVENFERLTLAEMQEFVENSRGVYSAAVEREAVYLVIERVLKAQQYRRLKKGQKGIVRRFLAKISGLSRVQLARLIRRWMDHRKVERLPAQRPSFRSPYTAADIALLAEVDAAHEDLSGPAVRHLLKRAFEVYENQEFQRLAGISPPGGPKRPARLPAGRYRPSGPPRRPGGVGIASTP